IGAEDTFKGLIDLVEMKAVYYNDDIGVDIDLVEIPDDLTAVAEQKRAKLVETLADADDDIAMLYLDGEEIDPDTLRAGIRRATVGMKLYPVLCGSALKNKGVQRLLDAVSYYLPSPLDVPPVKGVTPDGEAAQRPSEVDAPTSALAFKVASDPYVGRLVFVRVYSRSEERR